MPSNSILIVDDTPNNIRLLFDVLDSAGFAISVVKSGETALEKLPHIKPDLILLDVMMPGIDGFETCRRIKLDPTMQDIPIIFMTALSDTENKVIGLKLGAVDYISKPIQVEEVLARVNVHLNLRNAQIQVEQEVIERKQAEIELKRTLMSMQQIQMQLIQSEKMSALGNLVAGVAHEINNPLGFLNGSLNNTSEYVQNLLEHMHLYQKEYRNPSLAIIDHAEKIELEYLCDDLPTIVQSMEEATKRIQTISNSLCSFSRTDSESKVIADLHEGINSTLLILKYRLKANEQRPAIKVITEYGNLPKIKCFSSQFNQVFMNILANAIDALDEFNVGLSFEAIKLNYNKITIKTSIENDYVKISIADNGKGMSEEVKTRIFDHLFTTKAIGKGTGLGLAIARQIVEEKHGGKLSCNSSLGKGTEFLIEIPI
jgi:signal transduction histidine kinase